MKIPGEDIPKLGLEIVAKALLVAEGKPVTEANLTTARKRLSKPIVVNPK